MKLYDTWKNYAAPGGFVYGTITSYKLIKCGVNLCGTRCNEFFSDVDLSSVSIFAAVQQCTVAVTSDAGLSASNTRMVRRAGIRGRHCALERTRANSAGRSGAMALRHQSRTVASELRVFNRFQIMKPNDAVDGQMTACIRATAFGTFHNLNVKQ